MRLRDCSFVVVDCETTGLHPSAHHRIIELALIPVDGSGRVGPAWCTLLNPGRDLGPTEIHGIRGRDLEGAPRFEDVVGDVIEHLAGRVLVAHNASFDVAFLEAELARASVPVLGLPALCTMQLAYRLGTSPGGTRLVDCCLHEGIVLEHAHSAEHDASACARLFRTYLRRLEADSVETLSELGCDLPITATLWPRIEAHAPVRVRGHRATARREPSFLADLVQRAARHPSVDTIEVASYLDVLDRALEDRRLSQAEQEDLSATAELLGLDADRVRSLHADYVGTLIALAYRDGVVTEREREDLDLVAEALGIDGVDDTLRRLADERAHAGKLDGGRSIAGLTVCFTGALLCSYDGEPITRDLAHLLAETAGMTVAARVTKSLDVLVVADPHSMSGKARKAQEYGTRIIAETAFWPMIGVEVS
jgi:DNA polymerase-3 subunit epsilon